MTLRELIHEIHRRSIWQVLGVYLVGSWVALQVVETLTASLGLPEWFPSLAVVLLIVGFPIVLATAIVQEGAPGAGEDDPETGAAVETVPLTRPDGGPASGLTSWLTWRNALSAGVVAFALWGMVAAGWVVLERSPDSGGGAGSGSPAAASLAVLPLDNYTGDPEQQYLADGIHEGLIHELTKIRTLTVKSRTSVMQFRQSGGPTPAIPEIAERLGGVDRVVEGSVFQLPGSDSLRVTIQLIDAPADEHLWSKEFWGELRQIRQLQGRLVREIAAQIRVELSPGVEARIAESRPGSEPMAREAVELYMRGRAEWRAGRPEATERSISFYRRALEIEPGYALAWAGLADAYLVLAHFRLPAHEAFPQAKAAAERAVDLDPELAEAHTARADTWFHYDWDWKSAEQGFRRALEINPGYATAHWWYAGLLAALGRMDESVAEITRARELDPLSPQNNGFAVRILYYARRFDDALEVVRRMRELGVSESMTPPWAALAHHARGDTERALQKLAEIPEERRNPYVRAALAQVLGASGEEERARHQVNVLERMYRDGGLHLPHLVAIGYAAVGESERALDWLETAAGDRDGALPWLTVDPAFDDLRDEPRFRTLVARMGLPEAGPGGQNVDPAVPSSP